MKSGPAWPIHQAKGRETNERKNKENKYIYPNVVLINFDAFNKFKTDKGILDFRIRDEEGYIETPIYRSIHLILENLVNKEYNKDIKKLAEFLSIKDIDTLRKTYEGDKNYMVCIRRVEELSTDPNFVGYYDLEEAHKQDLSDSYETGKSDEKIEIAKVMLQDTNNYEVISKYTGLSIEEIEQLQ